jgi:RHS repeat-associated protein
VTTNTGHTTTFRYDGLGRRAAAVEQDPNGTPVETRTLWCTDTPCATRTPDGTITARYLEQGEIGANGSPYYYRRDHLGSVTAMTDATGTVLGTLRTDPFGFAESATGTSPTFGFARLLSHAPSGLDLSRTRAYDPFTARWLSRDPIGEAGGVNLYQYVGNNPVNLIDPEGLCVEAAIGKVSEPYLPVSAPQTADIGSDLEDYGGGVPRFVPTPKGASQFIFPNGTVLRFDILPGQYLSRQGPHINIEGPSFNIHIPVAP